MPSRSRTPWKAETEREAVRENQWYQDESVSKDTNENVFSCSPYFSLPSSLSNELIILREEDSSGSITSAKAVQGKKCLWQGVSMCVWLMSICLRACWLIPPHVTTLKHHTLRRLFPLLIFTHTQMPTHTHECTQTHTHSLSFFLYTYTWYRKLGCLCLPLIYT